MEFPRAGDAGRGILHIDQLVGRMDFAIGGQYNSAQNVLEKRSNNMIDQRPQRHPIVIDAPDRFAGAVTFSRSN